MGPSWELVCKSGYAVSKIIKNLLTDPNTDSMDLEPGLQKQHNPQSQLM
jgi:hypothetical protein